MSVGLSFGSITSGTGIDVDATVSQILSIQQAVEQPWKDQLASLQSQDTALSAIGTDLSTLSSSLQALTDFTGVFASKKGSSSNTDVLQLASASTSATSGSHSITVTSLAQTSSNYSSVIANSNDTLSGSLTIQIGMGTAQTITVGSTSNTLSSLMAAINGASIGVKASIIKDTTGSRLSLVSTTSGAAGQMTISSTLQDDTTGTGLSFTQGQEGKDASVNVDGLDVTVSSNTVSDVIPGVTFQLLATSSQPVQVQITNDNASIETAMSSFVTAYNKVISDLSSQEGKDSSGKAEPLYGSPTLALLQSQLSSALLGGKASGTLSNIGQLGLSLNRDGSLSFDSSVMEVALNSSFDDVMGYLQNSGGFGQTMTSALNGLSSSRTSGVIYLALLQNSNQEASLNKSIDAQEARIAAQKIQLTTQMNTVNQILQSLPDQLNQVDQMYNAITGYSRTT